MKYLLPLSLLMLTNALTSCVQAAEAPAVKLPATVTAVPAPLSNTFVRGVYWPWERTSQTAETAKMETWQFAEKVLGDLKAKYHVDLIWVVNIGSEEAVRLAALADKQSIAVVPVMRAMYDYRNVRTLHAAGLMAEETVGAFRASKGIAGYVLLDEPQSGEMEQLEQVRGALAKLDPSRPALAVSMPRQTEAVARRTNLPFLVTDAYPFFGPGDPNGPSTPTVSRAYYIDASRRTAELARETGKTAWMMPQVFNDVWGYWHYDKKMNVVAEPGAYYHWRMPSTGETRWQIWQAIAAGAKGAVFYVLFPTPNPRSSAADAKDMKGFILQKTDPSFPLLKTQQVLNEGTGLLYTDGSPTVQMEAMGNVFSQLEPHRELIGRLQPTLPLAYADAPVRASTFCDPATGNTIIVLVNDNTEAAVTAKVRLIPNITSARDLVAASDILAQQDTVTGLSTLSLKIGAGEGKLLVLNGQVAATQTYVENFAIQLSVGSLTDIEKVLLPEEWGLGYQVGVKTLADITPTPIAPGQLQYALSDVAGDRGRMGGRFYLVYSASGRAEGQNVEVSVSADGVKFEPLAVDRPDEPLVIPATAAHLRFRLLNKDALLKGWQLISTP